MERSSFSESIKTATSETIVSRVKTFTKIDDFKVSEAEVEKSELGDLRLVVIILAGDQIHQTFKFFFNFEDSRYLLSKIQKEQVTDEQGEKLVIDLFKELSNLVAGHMKNMYLDVGVQCNISLPIALRGFDNLFFAEEARDPMFTDSWRIDHEGGSFYCSNHIKVDKSLQIENFGFDETSDEIDFF